MFIRDADTNLKPIGIFYSCSFWNFYASIVFGFMIWAACIVFRLLRLHLLFNHGINSIKGLSLANQPFTIILLLCIPHLIVYGVFLPLSGAVVRREVVSESKGIVTAQCLYSSPFWAWTDNILFFAVWALLYGSCLHLTWNSFHVPPPEKLSHPTQRPHTLSA